MALECFQGYCRMLDTSAVLRLVAAGQ